MNDSNRVMRRPRRAWPSAARTAAAIIATAALVLLAAACSGSPSSTDPGGSSTGPGSSSSAGGSANSSNAGRSPNSKLLAFSQCMRSHSVPNFPDPQPGASNAKFPSAQQLGVSSSQYQSAENACQHLLPAGVDDQFPPAEVQQLLIGMRQFSQCMRSHAVPNWPDPSTDSEGRPFFNLSGHGFSRQQAHSPQLGAKEVECQHLLPNALGGLPEG
jgi:hypothetical protein